MKQAIINIFFGIALIAITFFNLIMLAGQHSRIRSLERVLEVISLRETK